MRTWRLREIAGPITRPALHEVSVCAFDYSEAAEELLHAAGLEPFPCCELEDEPCEGCTADARLNAQDRAEEGRSVTRARFAKP